MTSSDENQWYTNKELFEMLNGMQKDFTDFRVELQETRTLIKSYNGLREEIAKMRAESEKLREESDAVKAQVQIIVSKQSGKQTALENVRNWGGWLFALATLMVLLFNQIN
jgi:DNA repair exonuclease SbcCD ATPase subunit